MWSTPSERTLAERQARADTDRREVRRTPRLRIEDRIARWRTQEQGLETEAPIELLCDAEDELRRLRSLVKGGAA